MIHLQASCHLRELGAQAITCALGVAREFRVRGGIALQRVEVLLGLLGRIIDEPGLSLDDLGVLQVPKGCTDAHFQAR